MLIKFNRLLTASCHFKRRKIMLETFLSELSEKDLDWFFKGFPGDKVTRYPLTNLGVDEDDILHVEVAVAGFSKEDIALEQNGNKLCLKGSKKEESKDIKYMQKHISTSNFERTIILHDNYVGGEVNASVADGICKITVKPKENLKNTIQIV